MDYYSGLREKDPEIRHVMYDCTVYLQSDCGDDSIRILNLIVYNPAFGWDSSFKVFNLHITVYNPSICWNDSTHLFHFSNETINVVLRV